MPTIYDGIDTPLYRGLSDALEGASRLDVCSGYFHLRGWGMLSSQVDALPGDGRGVCRVLIGMQRAPEDQMKLEQGVGSEDGEADFGGAPAAARLSREVVNSFAAQISFGLPSHKALSALQALARQLREGKVRVRLYLRQPLHAKLYLVNRPTTIAPLVGFVGSSNLTRPGLSGQGELNMDVLEQDAAVKLSEWFEARWDDGLTMDITEELAKLIETSWASEELFSPHSVYLKMAYHLSQDARLSEEEFELPADLRTDLLEFQGQAVKLSTKLLYRRGGVVLGDVVGLGKTLMATAMARLLHEEDNSSVLVICPPRLMAMWSRYLEHYAIPGRVLSMGKVIDDLPELRPFKLVIVDESHNFRNRESRRYRALHSYLEESSARVVLLTATPYNRDFHDLSAQLRLFVEEDEDLGIRPEGYFREDVEEADFVSRFQASPTSIRAFEQSTHPEDWQDLLRLFMVRRTRSFIERNYATYDSGRDRHYLEASTGRFYFPKRNPDTVPFDLDESYSRLYSADVVSLIENLALPRYGLALYLRPGVEQKATAQQRTVIADLGKAGRRLVGFSRTRLFKRLESSGESFLTSVRLHVLRNMIFAHALEEGLELPLGTQEGTLLLASLEESSPVDQEEEGAVLDGRRDDSAYSIASFASAAARAYETYATSQASRFRWVPASMFKPSLKEALLSDARTLVEGVLREAGRWDPDEDAKLGELVRLVGEKHADEKVLIFTQFADTAQYLGEELERRRVGGVEVATSATASPGEVARRFSPRSNGGPLGSEETEIRVLVSTDSLSEGQNLQDCSIVVNYDLPWAIIRLIQRAGRVDRIGQENDTVRVYSFMPAEGVEQVIGLRRRLVSRLEDNREVVGSEETFFGEEGERHLRELYTGEEAALKDEESESGEVDLTSIALQVWEGASEAEKRRAIALPAVAYATKEHRESAGGDPGGVLAYARVRRGGSVHDMLVRVGPGGRVLSQSAAQILRAAACPHDEPALQPMQDHHELVASGVAHIARELTSGRGRLGPPSSVRRKLYERLASFKQGLPPRKRSRRPGSSWTC